MKWKWAIMFTVFTVYMLCEFRAEAQTETADIMNHILADMDRGAFSEDGNTWAEMRETFRRKKPLILDMYVQTSRLQKVSRADFERYNYGHVSPACSQYQWAVTRPLLYALAVNIKDLMEFVERAPDMPYGPKKHQQYQRLREKFNALKAQDIHGPCGTSK